MEKLVLYNVTYRGRLGLPSHKEINVDNCFHDYYHSLIADDGFNDPCSKVFVYAHPVDKRRFGRPIVTFKYLGRSNNSGKVDVPFEFSPCEAIKSLDSSFELFKGFDEYNDIIRPLLEIASDERESKLIESHRLKEKWKKLLKIT